jgi:hypothetical protein
VRAFVIRLTTACGAKREIVYRTSDGRPPLEWVVPLRTKATATVLPEKPPHSADLSLRERRFEFVFASELGMVWDYEEVVT